MDDLFELSGLIIEADLEKRSRCTQAARVNNIFRKIQAIAHPRDFEARVGEGQAFDVIFIGGGISSETIIDLVRIAKERSEDCACIRISSGHEQDATALASTMVCGIDGFLYEPFSVDGLAQVAEVAQELKRVNQERRIKATIKLIVVEILNTVDDVSVGRSAGRPTPNSSATLARLSDAISRLGPEALPFYYEELIEKSADRIVPLVPVTAAPSGSRRKDRKIARWERGNR